MMCLSESPTSLTRPDATHHRQITSLGYKTNADQISCSRELAKVSRCSNVGFSAVRLNRAKRAKRELTQTGSGLDEVI